MRNQREFGVAVVTVLLVLAAGCTAVGFTTDIGADTNAQMQQNTQAVEPNDNRANATPIEFGEGEVAEGLGFVNQELNRTVENGTVVEEDVDFYKFNASAGQAINVYLLGGRATSVNVALFDPSGEVLGSANSTSDPTTIGGVADETSTYYIRVKASPLVIAENVEYSFVVEIADQDSFEPNDAIANATPVTSGEHINGTIAKGDKDVFAIEASAGETITVSVALRSTNVLNQGNIAIDILNANGERLNDVSRIENEIEGLTNSTTLSGVSGFTTSARTETVNVTVEETGTYYIRVTESPVSGDITNIGGFRKYGLDVTTSGADQPTETPSDAEPNDDRQNATHVPIGVEIEGDAGIRENGTDVDWFAFNVSAGHAFNVVHGGTAANVSIYGPDGELLKTAPGGVVDIWVTGAVADETGTYYLRITGGTYYFTVETAPPDSVEPNDDRQNATPIESGDRVTAALFEGEQDWYAVEVTEGQNLTAVVERLSGAADPAQNVRIDLFAPDGTPVGEGFVPDGGVSTAPLNQTDVSGVTSRDTVGQYVTADETGTYYVRISPVEGLTGFVKYELSVNTSGAAETPTTTPTETPEETDTPEETSTPTETTQPTTDAPTETPTESPTETETPQPTPTETPEQTETPSEAPTEQPTESDDEQPTEQPTAEQGVAYYQVDFVATDPIKDLRGPEGTYADDQLIRFVHGSTEKPVMRRAPGVLAYAENNDLAERIESQKITVENGTATVTFTVAEGAEPVELSLVSYTKPGPGWSPATETKQEFVDAETGTFGPGTYTLTVSLPGEDDEVNDDGTAAADDEGGELSVVGLSADADGNDNNLNDEYIVYENTGTEPLNLTGWTVTDSEGNTFTFPDGFTLAPGEQVTLYTGSGTNTESALYWGQASEVWNDGADMMTVRNAAGEIVLQRSYP